MNKSKGNNEGERWSEKIEYIHNIKSALMFSHDLFLPSDSNYLRFEKKRIIWNGKKWKCNYSKKKHFMQIIFFLFPYFFTFCIMS